jgi:hypothetical protein
VETEVPAKVQNSMYINSGTRELALWGGVVDATKFPTFPIFPIFLMFPMFPTLSLPSDSCSAEYITLAPCHDPRFGSWGKDREGLCVECTGYQALAWRRMLQLLGLGPWPTKAGTSGQCS